MSYLTGALRRLRAGKDPQVRVPGGLLCVLTASAGALASESRSERLRAYLRLGGLSPN